MAGGCRVFITSQGWVSPRIPHQGPGRRGYHFSQVETLKTRRFRRTWMKGPLGVRWIQRDMYQWMDGCKDVRRLIVLHGEIDSK